MGAPRLHIEVDGDGPTLILGHGFGGSARNFGAQARALAGHYRVVRFDARGHARSEAPDDPAAYRAEAFVDDVGRVLDAVGATRAVVGGLSMGAGIALRFAIAYPERTCGLVLASFPAGAAAPGSLAAVAAAFADAIEHEGLEAAGARFVWGGESGLDARAAALIRRGFLEHAPHALAFTLRGLIAVQPSVPALVSVLPSVAPPALLVAGAADRLSLDASQGLVAALPDARLAIIANAGHLVNIAQPATFNATLAAFLERVALLRGDRSGEG